MSECLNLTPVIRQHIAGQGYYAQVIRLKGGDSGGFVVVTGCFHHHDNEERAQNCANRMYRTLMRKLARQEAP